MNFHSHFFLHLFILNTLFTFCYFIVTGYGIKKSSKFLNIIKDSRAMSPLYASISPMNAAERKTFKRFMQVELWKSPELEDLYPILCSIENACRDVNRLMRRVSTDNLQGYYPGSDASAVVNIQGEDQKKLDVIANRILKTALCCSGKVDVVASEEDDEPCLCSTVTDNAAFSGDFAAVFDPMDGSSNIDGGLPTGTIIGVYRNPKFRVKKDPTASVIQKGSELLFAGYCLYSASTHFVCTIRNGVHQFTLDDVSGEFYLTRSNIIIPSSGPIYSFNDANSDKWNPNVKKYISDFKSGNMTGRSSLKKPTARYMGALVADIHNIIRKGGIFGYPGEVHKPNGKLRLLYEANPLALIIEQAGGLASSGNQRILDMTLNNIHQRTPFFIGSKEEILCLEKYLSEDKNI